MSDETALVVSTDGPRATGGLVPANMMEAIQLANLMAKSGLVPDHLQDKPANCLLVIEQSSRWQMSPFAVAQCSSVIRGKLMYEGKLVAAVVNSRGGLAERLSYQFDGSGDKLAVTVSGRLKTETAARTVRVEIAKVRTQNECWKTQPEQQLTYAGARIWARRHYPEVMLGVYAPEEPFEDEGPEPTPEQKEWANYTGPKGQSQQASSPSVSDADSVETLAESTGKQVDELIAGPPQEEREPGSDDDWAPSDEHTPAPGQWRDQVECWTWKGAKGNKQWGEGEGDWVSTGMEAQRSLEQNAKLHALWGELGISDEDRRSRLIRNYNKESSADLSVREASQIIDRLEDSKKRFGTKADKDAKKERRAQRAFNEIGQELGARGIRPSDIDK